MPWVTIVLNWPLTDQDTEHKLRAREQRDSSCWKMEIPRSVSGFKYCDLLKIFGPITFPRNYLEANRLKLRKGECLVGISVEAPDKLAKERTPVQGL